MRWTGGAVASFLTLGGADEEQAHDGDEKKAGMSAISHDYVREFWRAASQLRANERSRGPKQMIYMFLQFGQKIIIVLLFDAAVIVRYRRINKIKTNNKQHCSCSCSFANNKVQRVTQRIVWRRCSRTILLVGRLLRRDPRHFLAAKATNGSRIESRRNTPLKKKTVRF